MNKNDCPHVPSSWRWAHVCKCGKVMDKIIEANRDQTLEHIQWLTEGSGDSEFIVQEIRRYVLKARGMHESPGGFVT